ncbi:hypothetical protein Pelo_18893 [Pelomyxa schiedti]|nr:hypothetical protein Pelo_18893 [Pelomyxa schiedti]
MAHIDAAGPLYANTKEVEITHWPDRDRMNPTGSAGSKTTNTTPPSKINKIAGITACHSNFGGRRDWVAIRGSILCQHQLGKLRWPERHALLGTECQKTGPCERTFGPVFIPLNSKTLLLGLDAALYYLIFDSHTTAAPTFTTVLSTAAPTTTAPLTTTNVPSAAAPTTVVAAPLLQSSMNYGYVGQLGNSWNQWRTKYWRDEHDVDLPDCFDDSEIQHEEPPQAAAAGNTQPTSVPVPGLQPACTFCVNPSLL